MNLLLSGLVLLFFTGCASMHSGSSKPKVDNIGIVSVFEDTLPVQNLAANSARAGNSVSFPLDSISTTINAELLETLQKSGKTAFIVNVDAETVKQGKVQAQNLKDIYLGNRYQALEEYFLSEAQKQGAEYLYIIHPAAHDSFRDYKAGYGLFCQSNPEKKNRLELKGYGLIRATLWNVKAKEVASRVNLTPDELFVNTAARCNQAQQTKASLQELVKNSARLSLQKMEILKN
ncbi:MAG: hypothetical protein AAGB31_08590 [Bdellovibrio sp.]